MKEGFLCPKDWLTFVSLCFTQLRSSARQPQRIGTAGSPARCTARCGSTHHVGHLLGRSHPPGPCRWPKSGRSPGGSSAPGLACYSSQVAGPCHPARPSRAWKKTLRSLSKSSSACAWTLVAHRVAWDPSLDAGRATRARRRPD